MSETEKGFDDARDALLNLTARIDRLWAFYVSFVAAIGGGIFFFSGDFNAMSGFLVFVSISLFFYLNGTALRATFTACADIAEILARAETPLDRAIYAYSGGQLSYRTMSKVVFLTHLLPLLLVSLKIIDVI